MNQIPNSTACIGIWDLDLGIYMITKNQQLTKELYESK